MITVNTSFAGDFDERTFVVLASNGQEVMRTTINEYENKIDISTLPVGLYFIKDLNNLGETQKLVVVD